GPPPEYPGASPGSSTSGGDVCAGIAILVFLPLVILFSVIHRLAAGHWWWEKDDGEPSPGSSSAALDTFLASDAALETVSFVYHVHSQLDAAASLCLDALKRTGLLYPDADDLVDKMFGQFVQLATDGHNTPHPHQ